MDIVLNQLETRVLGCLIEKSVTTPEYYPLTLAALTAACNQKSNRQPVIQTDEKEVVRALDGLREKKLASAVALANSRVMKYRHTLPDVIHLTDRQLAILCELMLRGPQTVGELRARAGRMATFADVQEVEATLRELSDPAGVQLVTNLPRQPGQREERYAHRLGEDPPETIDPAPLPPEPARLAVMAENERLTELENRVSDLTDELNSLKAQFSDFVKQFH
ncbi:MAG: YceH family protein [Kiritimatiellia bacterium]|jgi:uncharacterized protein YceH (UPF0502 family)